MSACEPSDNKLIVSDLLVLKIMNSRRCRSTFIFKIKLFIVSIFRNYNAENILFATVYPETYSEIS